MGSFIARQPNGLLCRFSTTVDCITHYNMTEQDYIEYRMQCAKKDAEYDLKQPGFIRPFKQVLDETTDCAITQKEFEKLLRTMGYDGEIPNIENE